ncbi:TPA: hypothetical protein MIN49_07375 [Klebsiella pneumoniae]|nr:hypothetical protein [Klebsiella pneumoniae]
MNNIKSITLFHASQSIPFITCIVKGVEENGNGIKLTLENGNSIYVKDYDYFSLSESRGGADNTAQRTIRHC